jgi:hypothetical protein
VPEFVPLTNTLTPGIGIPALSETTPVTALSCASGYNSTTNRTMIPLNFSFIFDYFELMQQNDNKMLIIPTYFNFSILYLLYCDNN